jgi:undecaprenyl-phosphate galactose phosphotransferase
MTGQRDGALAPTPTHHQRAVAAVIRQCALFGADLGAVLLASTMAFLLHMAQTPPLQRAVERAMAYGLNWSGWGTLLVLALMLTYFGARGHYTLRLPSWLELKGIVVGVVVAFVADGLLRSFVFDMPYGFESALRWLLMIPAILLTRHATRVILQQYGLWTLRTLMLAEQSALRDAQTVLNAEPALGYDVIATASLEEVADWTDGGIAAAIQNAGCEFVVLVVGAGDASAERNVISAFDRLGVKYAPVPAVKCSPPPATGPINQHSDYQTSSNQHQFTQGVVMMVQDDRMTRALSRKAKAGFDSIVASLLLVLLSPLFLVLFWKVRADNGPALFGHERIGANGKRFRCLKFRTMVTNADQVLADLLHTDAAARAEWAAKRKLTNDPRVTEIGAFLRKTSLDELPQLINVIRGEMSLVGPRPIVEAEAHHYGYDFVYYCDTKPGITGLWQVSGRSSTTYEERVKLDVWYVQNWSLWHDGAILLKTIPAVLMRRGAI